MPIILGDGSRDEDGGGATHGVRGGGGVLVIGVLEVAGKRRVPRVFKMAVGPTVRCVGTKLGTAHGGRGEDGWGGRRGIRWRDRARYGRSSGDTGRRGVAWSGLADRVGAVETCAAGSGSETAILVSGAEVDGEICHSFGGLGFGAPFSARDLEEPSC